MKIRELITKLGFQVDTAKLAEYNAHIGATKEKVNALVGNITQGLRNVRNSGLMMTAGVTLPIVLMGKKMLDTAADAEETESKFKATFRSMAKEAMTWADTFGEAVGRSDIEIKNNLAALQAFSVGLGFSTEKAFKMSTQLETLSVDFASFHNISDDEAMQRFISAMSGSSEVVDKFGINLKSTNLDLKLLAMGYNKVAKGATEQQKAEARLAIIAEAMGMQGAIGDAIRTAGSYVNMKKRLQRETDKLAETWGKILIPVAQKVVKGLMLITKWINGLNPWVKKSILVFAALAAAIGPLLVIFSSLGLMIIGIKSSMLALAPVLAKGFLAMLAPIGIILAKIALVIAAIAAIGYAIWLVYDDIKTWSEGGDSLIGILLGSFERFFGRVTYMWRAIKRVFSSLWIALTTGSDEAFENFKSSVGELFSGIKKAFLKALGKGADVEMRLGEILLAVLKKSLMFIGRIAMSINSLLFSIIKNSIKFLVKEIDSLLSKTFSLKFLDELLIKKAPGLAKVFELKSELGQGQSALRTMLPPRALAMSNTMNTSSSTKNINLQSKVDLSVPEGTPEYQKEYLQNAADEIFDKKLHRVLSEAIESNPQVEK